MEQAYLNATLLREDKQKSSHFRYQTIEIPMAIASHRPNQENHSTHEKCTKNSKTTYK